MPGKPQSHLDDRLSSWSWPTRCRADRVAGLEEAAVTCSDLGAAGSLSTQARPLPWPHLPQVSLRKTNAA